MSDARQRALTQRRAVMAPLKRYPLRMSTPEMLPTRHEFHPPELIHLDGSVQGRSGESQELLSRSCDTSFLARGCSAPVGSESQGGGSEYQVSITTPKIRQVTQ